jgi:hypothetical protein
LFSRKNISWETKIKILDNIDCENMLLKQFIRISYRQKYISASNYREWSKKTTETGKIIGGFLKYAEKSR